MVEGNRDACPADAVGLLKQVLCMLSQQKSDLETQLLAIKNVADRQGILEGFLSTQRQGLMLVDAKTPSECNEQRQQCQQRQQHRQRQQHQKYQQQHPQHQEQLSLEQQGSNAEENVDGSRKSSRTTAKLVDYSDERQHESKPKTKYGLLSAGKSQVADRVFESVTSASTASLRRKIVSAKFELGIGIIILADTIAFALSLQWSGVEAGASLGFGSVSTSGDTKTFALRMLEYLFLAVYAIECLLRAWALRTNYFMSKANVFDLFILLLGICEVVFLPFGGSVALMRVMRLLRLLRVLRLAKIVRLLSMCQDLHILLKTVSSSAYSLLWSMAFTSLCIIAASLTLCQLVLLFLQDENADPNVRYWAYENFGTTSRAMLSLFEAAFSTKWTEFARPMIYDINGYFSIFWVVYVIGVNFAIIRVVSAMFLKQALAVARVEEERMAAASLKERTRIMNKLKQVCLVGDTSGDGKISQDEFNAMMENRAVVDLLAELDIEAEEAEMLFGLLSEGAGEADFQEFIAGAMKMKSSARTVDTIQILHQLNVLRKLLGAQVSEPQDVGAQVHAPSPCGIATTEPLSPRELSHMRL